MSGITAFFRLIRFTNLVMLAVILFLVKFCLVNPLSELASTPPCMANFHWILLGVATVLIAASGNVINDIMDQDIDQINKPKKLVVGAAISESSAWNIYYALSAIGIGAGIWLSEMLSSQFHGAIFVFCSAGLWFYSQNFKRQFLIGNLVIALLGSLVLLMPFFMEYRCIIADSIVAEAIAEHGGKIIFPWQGFVFMFAGFSFITTLIREVIKDMQDMNGDEEQGAATLPIKLGFGITKWITILLTLVMMLAVSWLQMLRYNANDQLTFYYLLIAVQLPSLILMILLFTAHRSKDMKAPSTLVKLIMLGGILCMLTLRYSFLMVG